MNFSHDHMTFGRFFIRLKRVLLGWVPRKRARRFEYRCKFQMDESLQDRAALRALILSAEEMDPGLFRVADAAEGCIEVRLSFFATEKAAIALLQRMGGEVRVFNFQVEGCAKVIPFRKRGPHVPRSLAHDLHESSTAPMHHGRMRYHSK